MAKTVIIGLCVGLPLALALSGVGAWLGHLLYLYVNAPG
jgi:hypothetical protein